MSERQSEFRGRSRVLFQVIELKRRYQDILVTHEAVKMCSENKTLVLDWENTHLFFFRDKQYDFICYVEKDKLNVIFMKGHDNLAGFLIKNDYPRSLIPFPSKDVIKWFSKREAINLDQEIEEFFNAEN